MEITNHDKGKRVIDEPGDPFGPWIVVQCATHGRSAKKAGEGTSSGANGNDGRKKKAHSAGTRFAILSNDDPNGSDHPQNITENVPSRETSPQAHQASHTLRPNKNSTSRPIQENSKQHTKKKNQSQPTKEPIKHTSNPTSNTNPQPTQDPSPQPTDDTIQNQHQKTNLPSSLNQGTTTNTYPFATAPLPPPQPHPHLQPQPPSSIGPEFSTNPSEHPTPTMELSSVPDTFLMEEDGNFNPDPEPPDLHSIPTEIMMEAVLQHEPRMENPEIDNAYMESEVVSEKDTSDSDDEDDEFSEDEESTSLDGTTRNASVTGGITGGFCGGRYRRILEGNYRWI
ncbi:hypothetical protein PIB30_103989 [Stylosanthes scabra]|uniref:Uncharacterized protein n=1 Tax=Stylosanthes scabra TaxID=79078 RepID=A0ABU6V1W9_9FABA|nr:hypothetical protein [Stylosanthes scabra]